GRRTLPCVLPCDHDGPHRNAFQEPWNSTDVPDHPHHVAAREAARARVSTGTGLSANCSTNTEGAPMSSTGRHVSTVTAAHVTRLHTLLSTPGVVTQAVRKLGDADRVFSMLDIALRRGAPVPARWAVSAQATGDVQELEH